MAETSQPPLSPEALEFAPGLLSIQEEPPRRLPRAVLYVVVVLFCIVLAWMLLGRIDVVATADGQLEPRSYVKIVQPADGGIVDQILVHENQHVRAGQILMRMDPRVAEADTKTLRAELALRSLQLRRIKAELTGGEMKKLSTDPSGLFARVKEQLLAHHQAYLASLSQAQDALLKARGDYEAAQQVLIKLKKVTPILKYQAEAYESMGKEGYVPAMTVGDKERKYLETSQDLRAQRNTVKGLHAAVAEARRHVEEVTSKYRSSLRDEWVDAESKYSKLQQDWSKQERKNGLLELRAPQSGIVQNLATHTVGTVVSPGTVLLSLVPDDEPLIASVRVKNGDVGFVYPRQKVKIKIAAYSFEKYGMLDGEVMSLSPDASGTSHATGSSKKVYSGANQDSHEKSYKALIGLKKQILHAQGKDLKLVPGMQVSAELVEGKRSVMEYLLSPVEKTLEGSGRER